MKNIVRKITTALGVVAVSASVAGAQVGSIAATCGVATILDTDVCYSTQYSFDGVTFGTDVFKVFSNATASYELRFAGQPTTTVSGVPFSFIDYGTVTASGTSSASLDLSGQQIWMRIIQTSPTAGSGVVGGLFGGTISGTASQAFINWNNPDRFETIGPVTYEVERFGQGFTSINAPSTGTQTIRGAVVNSVVPEPSTYMLLATGMGALGLVARRRRNNV